MPGGLNEVVQQVGADASKYISEYRAALAVTKELNAAHKELQQAIAAGQGAGGGAGGGAAAAADIARMNAEIRAGLSLARDFQQATSAGAAATAGFGAAHAAAAAQVAATSAAIRDTTGSVSDMTAKFEAARASIGAMAADAQAQSDRIAAGFERGSAQVRVFSTDVAGLRSSASDAAAAVDDVSRAVDVLRAKASGAGPSSVSVLGPALAAAMASGGGGAGGGTTDAATAAVIARNLAGRGYGPTPGSTSAVDTALAALVGGAAGGGGGDGGSGFLGAFGDALKPSSIFGGAMGTVKMAHMIAMFTMETLSTVIPAGVALAAAGATGLQGGTNVATSGTSLYNATEALGGAYGKTFGSYLGLGSSFQAAQNMANGGVYGITGGVLNLAGQGRDAFSNMGVQTIAMIDRGVAGMVLNNRMSAVGAALAGGTQDLRSFGDIGANIGDTLLNLAPALPGLGPDLLGGLKGITGAASFVTGHVPLPLLGAGLAAEAGYRWGDLALAGGKMPWFLGGKQISGLSGVASRMGLGSLPMSAADAEAAGLLPEGAAAAGEGGIAGTGLAGLLAGGAAGLPIGALTAIAALSAYGISKGSFGTLASRQMGGYLGPINQSFGANAWQPISKALYQASAVQANLPGLSTDTVAGQQVTVGQPIGELMRQGMSHAQAVAAYSAEFASNTKQLADMQANLIEAGPQAVKALQSMGIKGASVAQALDVMTEAMVSPSMIGTGGKLSPAAKQLMKQFETTYAPMTGTAPGAISAAASAQDIMSYSGMKSLQTLNSAMDSVSQIITGGASGAATQAAVQASLPSAKNMAKALGASPFSAAGSSAWAAFTTGTSAAPGVISTLQSEGDQLRTYLTLGALNSGQAGALGAYEARQFLPDVKGSPMAMAMLAQQAVAGGVPGAGYYNSGLSPAQNYAALQKALTQHGISGQHAAALLTQGTIKTADLPALAASLITSQTGASALDTAEVTQAGTQALAVQQAVAAGKPLGGNLSGLVATLMAGGAKSSGAVSAGLTSILGQEGIGGSKLSGLVQQGQVIYKAEYQRTSPPKPADQTYNVKANVHKPAIPQVADQSFQIRGQLHYPSIPGPPANQSYTITAILRTIGSTPSGPALATLPGAGGTRIVAGQTGFKVPGYGGGDTFGPAMLEPGELVVPKHMVAAGAVDHLRGSIPGFAAGGIAYGDVPNITGVGVAFRIAMQDTIDGLVNALNGMFGQVTSSIRTAGSSFGMGGPGGLQPSGGPVPRGTAADPVAVHVASVSPAAGALPAGVGGAPVPAAASKIFDAFEKTFAGMPSPWKGLASQILNGLIDGIKNAPKETASMAQALVNKVKTEIAYGQGVTATAVQGLNFPGMQVATPTMTAQGQPYQYYTDQQNIAAGGQPGSVQEQMGSYLQAMKSFQGDMGKLAKGGLEKRLMSQLYSAGPIQGDAEAQSILGGAGGIKAANNLYNQINSVATKLGVSAIGNVYGQPAAMQGKTVKAGVVANAAPVHALQSAINGLHGKTVTIKVQVETGSGSGGSGGVDLSAAQIKTLTSKVQAALLQQAKRNRKTGIQLPGYGS